jgi:hypothetical protein
MQSMHGGVAAGGGSGSEVLQLWQDKPEHREDDTLGKKRRALLQLGDGARRR